MERIILPNFILTTVNRHDIEHLSFLQNLFQNKEDKAIEFLGHLETVFDDNTFIIENKNMEKIGYFSKSDPVINVLSLSSVSLYYAISPKYRGNGYATLLLQEISQNLLEKSDMLVLKIHKDNIASIKVAENAGFQVEFKSDGDEDIIYTKYANVKNKTRL